MDDTTFWGVKAVVGSRAGVGGSDVVSLPVALPVLLRLEEGLFRAFDTPFLAFSFSLSTEVGLELLPEVPVVVGLLLALGLVVVLPLLLTLLRFRDLMTFVFSEIGRGLPCNLRNSPHALHSIWPYSLRRHSGVLEV